MDNFSLLIRQLKPMLNILTNNKGFADGDEGDEGGGTNEFFAGLSEETRGLNLNAEGKSTLEKFESADAMAKSYIELESKIGAKGIIVPDENATPEAKEQFLNDLGRPVNPADYKLASIENLHESIKSTPESEAAYKGLAHKLGLTQEQADGMNQSLMAAVNEVVVQDEKKQNDAKQATETALRSEWKENYDSNIALVGKVAAQALGEEGLKALGGAEGLGNNPYFNKMVYAIASQLSEDAIKNIQATPTSQGGGDAEAGAGAEKEIQEILNLTGEAKEKHPYWNENDPNHKKEVERVRELYKTADKAKQEAGA